MDLRVGSDVKSLRLGLDSLMGFAGFSTLVASFLGIMIVIPVQLFEEGDGTDIFLCRLAAALILAVAFAVFHSLAQFLGRIGGVPLLLCALVGLGSFVVMVVLTNLSTSFVFALVASYLLSCLGAVGLGCMWFYQLCKHSGKMVLSFIAVGLGVGDIICFGISFMNAFAAQVSLGVCLCVSVVLSALLLREARSDFTCQIENKASDRRSKIKPVSAIMLSLSFFEFGFVLSFSTQANAIGACVCASIFACLALAVDSATKGLVTERSLSPLNPPLTVMAFLLIFMFGHTTQVIALCVVSVLCTVYIAFGWTAMIQHVRLCKLAPLRVYAKARIVDWLGFAAGIGCGFAAVILPPEYGACLGVAVAGAFCLLSFFCHKPRFPESGFSSEGEAVPEGTRATWERRCKAVGEKFELSDRQQEVLVLMAQGRNAKYIENALTISLSTVQTHIRNIYRKLGVHSRQELLDLIESTKLYGED